MEGLLSAGLSRTQAAFLMLLRAGLWSHEVEQQSIFPLESEEWQMVMQHAREQTVEGIVFEGLSFLPPHLLPPQTLRWQWITTLASIQKGYERTIDAATKSLAILRDMGVDIVLMKGIATAQYYDKPQRRVNGDIDWYVRQPYSVRELSQELSHRGITPQTHSDGSIVFQVNDIIVELHQELLDFHSPRGRRLANRLVQEEGTVTKTLPNGTEVNVPTPVTTLLMLSAHILKHISTVGLGLRQFCDTARAYYHFHQRYDATQLDSLYTQARLQRWQSLLQRFLVQVLQTPPEVVPHCPTVERQLSPDVARLLKTVLKDGNFGQNSQTQTHLTQKIATACKMMRHSSLALRYAPQETLYYILQLLKTN